MLVSMGSALFVMIPLQAEGDSTFASTNALSRTLQDVTTGVGFLGAGLINFATNFFDERDTESKGTHYCSFGLGGSSTGSGNGLWFVAGELTRSVFNFIYFK